MYHNHLQTNKLSQSNITSSTKTLDNTFHIHFSFTGIPSNMQNMHNMQGNMQNAAVKPAVQKYSRKSIITFCQYRYGREFF